MHQRLQGFSQAISSEALAISELISKEILQQALTDQEQGKKFIEEFTRDNFSESGCAAYRKCYNSRNKDVKLLAKQLALILINHVDQLQRVHLHIFHDLGFHFSQQHIEKHEHREQLIEKFRYFLQRYEEADVKCRDEVFYKDILCIRRLLYEGGSKAVISIPSEKKQRYIACVENFFEKNDEPLIFDLCIGLTRLGISFQNFKQSVQDKFLAQVSGGLERLRNEQKTYDILEHLKILTDFGLTSLGKNNHVFLQHLTSFLFAKVLELQDIAFFFECILLLHKMGLMHLAQHETKRAMKDMLSSLCQQQLLTAFFQEKTFIFEQGLSVFKTFDVLQIRWTQLSQSDQEGLLKCFLPCLEGFTKSFFDSVKQQDSNSVAAQRSMVLDFVTALAAVGLGWEDPLLQSYKLDVLLSQLLVSQPPLEISEQEALCWSLRTMGLVWDPKIGSVTAIDKAAVAPLLQAVYALESTKMPIAKASLLYEWGVLGCSEESFLKECKSFFDVMEQPDVSAAFTRQAGPKQRYDRKLIYLLFSTGLQAEYCQKDWYQSCVKRLQAQHGQVYCPSTQQRYIFEWMRDNYQGVWQSEYACLDGAVSVDMCVTLPNGEKIGIEIDNFMYHGAHEAVHDKRRDDMIIASKACQRICRFSINQGDTQEIVAARLLKFAAESGLCQGPNKISALKALPSLQPVKPNPPSSKP